MIFIFHHYTGCLYKVILIYLLLSSSFIFATTQYSEKIIFRGKSHYLDVHKFSTLTKLLEILI